MHCTTISTEKMADFINSGSITVVDTRPVSLFSKYRIKGSIRYRDFLISIKKEGYPENGKIAFVCSGGNKSMKIGISFSRRSGVETYSLHGGLKEFTMKHIDLMTGDGE